MAREKRIVNRTFHHYQRCAILVDVQNIFYSAKNIYKGKVDYNKLMNLALDKRRLIRAIAYVVETPEVNQEGFLTFLDKHGFQIKSKPLKVRADGSSKGDWDMGIAIDAITLANKIDVIVLVSGDGDYTSLINLLKSMGVFIEVMSFRNSTSEDLVKAADKYIAMGKEHLLE